MLASLKHAQLELFRIYEDLVTDNNQYLVTIERATPDDIEFQIEVKRKIEKIHELYFDITETINEFDAKVYDSSEVIIRLDAPKIDTRDVINNQKNIFRLIHRTLNFPLDIDNYKFLMRLCNLVFYDDMSTGPAKRVEKQARLFLIVVTSFMFMKKFGGEMFISNGICVKLKNPECLILVEQQCKADRRLDDWIWEVNEQLTEYISNPIQFPDELEGVIRI